MEKKKSATVKMCWEIEVPCDMIPALQKDLDTLAFGIREIKAAIANDPSGALYAVVKDRWFWTMKYAMQNSLLGNESHYTTDEAGRYLDFGKSYLLYSQLCHDLQETPHSLMLIKLAFHEPSGPQWPGINVTDPRLKPPGKSR